MSLLSLSPSKFLSLPTLVFLCVQSAVVLSRTVCTRQNNKVCWGVCETSAVNYAGRHLQGEELIEIRRFSFLKRKILLHNGHCGVQSELDIQHEIQNVGFHISKHSAVTRVNSKCSNSKKLNTLGICRLKNLEDYWGSHCLFLNTHFVRTLRESPVTVCTV